MTPSVQILLPIFNAEETLGAAIDSLRGQTFTHFSCLLIDDGSEDRSAAIAASAAKADPRFEWVRLPHGGIVAALNAGLDRIMPGSTDPGAPRRPPEEPFYIARMDADDLSMSTRLEAQVDLLKSRPDLDLVASRWSIFNSSGGDLGSGMLRYTRWANGILDPATHTRERFVESPIAHSAVMARPWIFAGGYRAGLGWAEDYDLWLRRLEQGARFAKVPEVLLQVRDDPHRTSRHDPRCTLAAFLSCRIHHLKQGPLANRGRVVVWGAGMVGKRWLRALPAAGIEVPAVVDINPRKLGFIIHGALVIPPEGLLAAMADLGGDEGPFCLVAVGTEGAREDIRQRVKPLGLEEEKHYLFVA